MGHGYPFMDALQFLDVDTTCVKKQLEDGKDAIESLLEHETGRFFDHLRFFVHMMSLSDAIFCAQALHDFEKGLKEKLIKKSVYPVFILVFAYVMLWFFSSAIIPQMMESFSMDDQFQGLSIMVVCSKWFCAIFGIGTCICIVFYLYLQTHPSTRSAILYRYHTKLSIVVDYESYMLAGYLMEMQKKGISTKLAFSFLSQIKENTVFHLLVQDIVEALQRGGEYVDVLSKHTLLNSAFSLACKVGSSSNTMVVTLASFMKQQEFIWDKTMKKLSVGLQVVSYSFVGFVVLIVYQIMLVPLSMLEQM